MAPHYAKRRVFQGACVAVLLGVAAYGSPNASPAASDGLTVHPTTASRITPVLAGDFKPHARVSAAKLARIDRGIHEMREAIAGKVTARTPAGAAPAGSTAAPSRGIPARPQFHGTPGAFIVGRNNPNPLANCTPNCSTLAEPAAANEGSRVLYSGNFRHVEFSTNGGQTYTNIGYPAGTAAAPTVCCDTDAVYDPARGVTFYSAMYTTCCTPAGRSVNGELAIFVRRNIAGGTNCFYRLDPDGVANNVVPDFPHIALSNDFLYISSNRLATSATSRTWVGSRIDRLGLDQMADCAAAPMTTFDSPTAQGQRILTPGEGAGAAMYFAWVENPSTLRLFTWPESSPLVSSQLKSVGAMTFGDPDCRGGTLNNDWADSLEASITGFNVRTAVQTGSDKVSVFISTAADAAHPQAHIHGFTFTVGSIPTSLSLTSSPVFFNATTCAGMPAVAANARGDLGLMIAFGGRAGGGGTAARPFMFMIDQFSPGPGGFTASLAAAGTHNRTDARYGDYFTVRPHSPDGLFFTATAYALNGGTDVANVNARYVEFGRGRDRQGYMAWRNAVPAT